jgi:hypothetical protein
LLVRVALRFITLGCGGVDIERLLNEQRHFQGTYGTNYPAGAMHAHMVLHESR